MFSMLLAWTPVSSNVINGVQGRYLLPLLPMFLLSLKNDKVVRTDWDDRGLLFAWPPWISTWCCACSAWYA